MRYELPLGVFITDILGFQGLFDIVEALERKIASEYSINLNDEALEYVVTKQDYEILMHELTRILAEEGIEVSFEENKVRFSDWARVPRAVTINGLMNGKLADRIREHFEGVSALEDESLLVYPASSKKGVIQSKYGKDFFRYRISDKQPEIIMDMDEQVYVLAFEAITNWFIREFVKKNFDKKSLLKSILLEEVNYSPSNAETAEEIDELQITFIAAIVVDGEEKTFRVETANWVEKEIKEISDE